MSRGKKRSPRKIIPDARYGSEMITRFINTIMEDGKKEVAEKIVYSALEMSKQKIIEKYGLEAGAIDLVNDKLSKNIELLVQQEKERNNAWLRENNENIQVAEDFFNQKHD